MPAKRTVFKFTGNKPVVACEYFDELSRLPIEAFSVISQLINLSTGPDFPIKGVLTKDGRPLELKKIYQRLHGELPSVVKGWNLLMEKEYIEKMTGGSFCVTRIYNDWLIYNKKKLSGHIGQANTEGEQAALFEGIPVTQREIELTELRSTRNDFEVFYAKYPVKKGKQQAWKHWLKLMKEGMTAKYLWACAVNLCAEIEIMGTNKTFILHPKNFLHPKKREFESYAPEVWQRPTKDAQGRVALIAASDEDFWKDAEDREKEREERKNDGG